MTHLTEQIRTEAIDKVTEALKNNCPYSYEEREVALEFVRVWQKPNKHYEEIINKHPEHGLTEEEIILGI